MKIISLSSATSGTACAVSTSIKKYYYNNNYITNIFDFLEITLESINQILNIQNNNIEEYLKTNNDIYLNKDNNYSIIFKNFDKVISHHDLPFKYNNDNYNNLIEKYVRRYNRFINDLKYEDVIFFIRFGIDNNNSIIYFINKIKELNPNLEYYYINVNYDEKNINSEFNNKNYYYLNFYNYLDTSIEYDKDLFYKTIQFNWKIIYDFIINKINEKYKDKLKYYG